MITALQIENFKGIGPADPPASPPFRIEFRPITLLFGANSSGKSTVIQALLYAHEILDRKNFDPDRTVLGGDVVDLGGFRTFAHRETSQPGEGPVRLRFDLDLSKESLPEFLTDEELLALAGVENSEQIERLRAELAEDNLSTRVQSAAVELQVEWSDYNEAAQLTSYTVWLNGNVFARIGDSPEGGRAAISDFNFDHPLLRAPVSAAPISSIGDEPEPEHVLSEFMQRYRAQPNKDNQDLPPGAVICNLERMTSALPDLDSLLRLEERSRDTAGLKESLERQMAAMLAQELVGFIASVERELQVRLRCVRILTQALAGPGQLIRNQLRRFRYVGPLRRIPPRSYAGTRSSDPGSWADGMAAWDALYRDDELVAKVSEWLGNGDGSGGPGRLNTGYALELRRIQEIDGRFKSAALRSDAIYEVIEEIAHALRVSTERKRLILMEQRSGLELHPFDMGVGISQVLPPVVAAVYSGADTIAIEQPELHVHPAVQVGLGDLLLEQAHEGRYFLVETHSEHLILRILRRVEETGSGTLPPDAPAATPEMIAVQYVSRNQEGRSAVVHLPIDETGEFTKEWPNGFFRERAKELFGD